MRRQTAEYDGRERSQLGSSFGQEVAGDRVVLGGGAQDDGKQAREIGWWSRVGLLHEVVDCAESPGFEDHGGELGFKALIVGAQEGGDGAAADPVAGAFVRDGEPPASGACDATARIAAVNDGAGAGDGDDAGTGAKRGFEGDYGVADNFDFCDSFGSQLGEDAAYLRGDLGPGGAGGADTDGADLSGSNLSGGADLTNGGVEGFSGLRLAEANHVAAAGHGGREDCSFVGKDAAGFCAPAVDSEVLGHRATSNPARGLF